MSAYRELLNHLGPAMIVLSRLVGLFIYAPILSSPMIPQRIKAALAVSMTAAVYTTLSPTLTQSDSFAVPFTLLNIAPILIVELMIGLAVGFLASLPLMACQLGGQTIGQQIGVGMARAFNPAMDDEAEVVGQMLFYLAMCAFIFLGGIEVMFGAVLDSFATIPLGGYVPDADLISTSIALLTSAFELALRIAAPVLALVFLETIALGFISKTAPAFNIMSLGFPLRVVVGIATLIVSSYAISEIIGDELVDMLETIRWLPWSHSP